MTRTALEGLGCKLLPTDEVVIEATGKRMAFSRVLSPFVRRVVIANPLQVKAIVHARVKTDKVDAGALASLFAARYLPEMWIPDAETERRRRLTARRYQVVRRGEDLDVLDREIAEAALDDGAVKRSDADQERSACDPACHLIPKCPHADLFNQRGEHRWGVRTRGRTSAKQSPGICANSTASAEDITGVKMTVAVAAIGIHRFSDPGKLVSFFGLNPRVRQPGLGPAHYGRISEVGRSHARAMLVEVA
jgi:transposase